MMVGSDQVERLIEMMWYGNYIGPEELTTLLKKLATACKGEYSELDEEEVISYFDSNTLPEILIRIGIRQRGYTETGWMKWIKDTIESEEFKNERRKD